MKHAEATAATRAALIRSFCHLYEALPLEKITVKEISDGARVSRVTFYNYFSDPYQLVEELEDDVIDTLIDNARVTIASGLDPEVFAEVFIETFEGRKPLVKMLFAGSHSGVFVNKAKDAVIGLIKPMIPNYDTNPFERYAVEYHVSGMVAVFQRWFGDGEENTDQMASIITEILLNSPLASLVKE